MMKTSIAFAAIIATIITTVAKAKDQHNIRGLERGLEEAMSFMHNAAVVDGEPEYGKDSSRSNSRSSRKGRSSCNTFEGLWQGIDQDDASDQKLSITCDADCDSCMVLYSDNFFRRTPCLGQPGTRNDKYDYDENGALTSDTLGSVTCQNGDSSDSKDQPNMFNLHRNGKLIEWSIGPNLVPFWRVSTM